MYRQFAMSSCEDEFWRKEEMEGRKRGRERREGKEGKGRGRREGKEGKGRGRREGKEGGEGGH